MAPKEWPVQHSNFLRMKDNDQLADAIRVGESTLPVEGVVAAVTGWGCAAWAPVIMDDIQSADADSHACMDTAKETNDMPVDMTRLRTAMDWLTGIAVLVTAGTALWTHYTVRTGPTIEPIAGEVVETRLLRHRLGSSPTVLIEFADYECPFCADHATGEFPQIKRELIDTGQLSYAYLHFPLTKAHPDAMSASIAAECAGDQGRYWEMHTNLFRDPEHLDADDLRIHAVDAGLDVDRFSSCMASSTKDRVMNDVAEAKRLGVKGTPTFFIGVDDRQGHVAINSQVRGGVTLAMAQELVTGGSLMRRLATKLGQLTH